jgi:flagellar hook-basal body complex protein FliE
MIENRPIDSADLLARLRTLAAQAQGSKTAEATAAAGTADFSSLLETALNKVNDVQTQASRLAGAVEAGDPDVSVADAMIAAQKSSISFQAMVQVRNKLVNAYQEIMSMQI